MHNKKWLNSPLKWPFKIPFIVKCTSWWLKIWFKKMLSGVIFCCRLILIYVFGTSDYYNLTLVPLITFPFVSHSLHLLSPLYFPFLLLSSSLLLFISFYFPLLPSSLLFFPLLFPSLFSSFFISPLYFSSFPLVNFTFSPSLFPILTQVSPNFLNPLPFKLSFLPFLSPHPSRDNLTSDK